MDLLVLNKILLGFTAGAHLVLGAVVYRKNPKARLNRLIMGLTIVVGFWALATLIILVQTEYTPLLRWVRISHATAAFTPWFVLAPAHTFLEEKYPKGALEGIFVFSCLLSALSMTPLIIAGMEYPLEDRVPIYGPWFPLYVAFFGGVFFYGIFNLFRHLRRVKGIVRNQIRLFLGGIVVSFLLGSLANLFFPLLGVTAAIDLRSYGPVFTLVMVVSFAYAVIKYRLMDIQMALRKLLVYTLTIAVLGGAYTLVYYLLTSHYAYWISPFLALSIFITMAIAVFFQPLKEFLRTAVVDRYFFRSVQDYYRTLIEANEALASILKLEELLEFLVNKVVEAAQIQKGVFFLRNKKTGTYEVLAEKTLQPASSEKGHPPLEENNPLVSYLLQRKDILLRSDLRQSKKALDIEVSDVLKEMEAEALVPVTMDRTLEGIFMLGPKLSGEPYSVEDVNLLSTLSSQLAVALKNAQSHREVAAMKQYLENVMENMRNGLVAVDGRGRIVTFNSALEEITGLKAAEVKGREVDKVLNPELGFLLRQTLAQNRSMVEVEFEIEVGGSWRFLCCSTALVDFSEKEERGAIMVLSDLTRLKELEREKNRAERLASLGELASGMAHEIKNPLVSIKTFAELLPERYEDLDFRHNFSQVVGEEIERINNLVTELLGFARQSEQSYLNVDVEEVLEEILLLLAPQLEVHTVEVEKHCQPGLPSVQVERRQFKQALFNICQNAVEAMPDGGTLKVRVLQADGAGKRGQKKIKAKDGGFGVGKIKILIEDSGEGISSDKLEKVFDPFFTTKDYGVGIGLSISHRILTEYGGSIQLYSTEGRGTSFEVILPANQA